MKKTIPYVLIALIFLFSCKNNSSENGGRHHEIEHEYFCGICIDSLDVVEGKVQKNDILSKILQKKGVSYNVVHSIAMDKRDVFDTRKIKVGNNFAFLMSRDSVPEAKYWIYEIDRTNFAVFGLTDSLPAWRYEKEVISKVATVAVEIESSLWNALSEAGCDPTLTLELSDIYAWTVDFFGIQQGDSCRAVYEEFYIDGDSLPYRTGRVLASYMKNKGEGYYAFYFEQNGDGDYFDQDGQNMRKAFLKAPLNYRRISSKFSNGRMHPVYHVVRPHHGVDYAAPAGTPVQAIGDGTVIAKGWDKKGGGNYLKIKHNSTYTTTYMHLKGFAKGIAQGCKVKQGQTIGYVGSTGASTGPHLDFRLQKNGTYIDPLKFKSPSATPVKKENMEQYMNDIKMLMVSLKSGV